MADLLVVDDNPDLAEALELVLLGSGHVVRVAHDGEEGLALVDQNHPDLILLDVEMPVLDGPGMVCEMVVHDAGKEKIPVILLSAIMDLHLVAARVGTPYFLEKPYSLDDLFSVLDRALVERCPPNPQRASSPAKLATERSSHAP